MSAPEVPKVPRPPLPRSVLDPASVAVVVFLVALLGIHTRPPGLLASIWFANAVALALVVRWPRHLRASSVFALFVGCVAADLVSGTEPYAAAVLNTANAVGVVAGALTIRWRRPEPLLLTGSPAFARLSVGIVVASVVSATVATCLSGLLVDVTPAVSPTAWFSSEFVSYLLLTTILLSIRAGGPWRPPTPRYFDSVQWTVTVPVLVAVTLMIAGMVADGPLLVALPLPALLWCATRIPFSGTALLTACWAGWNLLIAGRVGVLGAGEATQSPVATLSVALVALGPLLVAAVTLDRMAVQNKLHQALEYDSLTGTLSRAAFLRRSQRRLNTLVDASQPVALLMLDLDDFKTINDTMGHAAGDIALVRSAGCILSALPHGAVAGRIGGEEFAVLLPMADHEDATAVADTIRRDHERLHLLSTRTATVSIGLAWAPAAPASVSPLLDTADRALYEAKRGGRNTVVAVTLA